MIRLNYANDVNKRNVSNRSTCKTSRHARTPSTWISLTDRAHGCAALSWRNSYGRQVLDRSRFRQPALSNADYKTILFFNRKTTIQERCAVLKNLANGWVFFYFQPISTIAEKGRDDRKFVKRGSLLLYHTNISSSHPVQIMIWTNLEKKTFSRQRTGELQEVSI